MDRYADIDVHSDGYTYCYTNRDRHSFVDCHLYWDVNPVFICNIHIDSDGHADDDAHLNNECYSDCDFHLDSLGNVDRNFDEHWDPDLNSDAIRDCNPHQDSYLGWNVFWDAYGGFLRDFYQHINYNLHQDRDGHSYGVSDLDFHAYLNLDRNRHR